MHMYGTNEVQARGLFYSPLPFGTPCTTAQLID